MRCLRDILGLTVDILKAAGELPVEEQLRHMRLQWIGHMKWMPDHWPQKQQVQTTGKEKKARWSFTAVD